jgi:hypothetical protein
MVLVVGLIISGCATPYGPNGFFGGYVDYPIGQNKYAISFNGNGYTSSSTCKMYALRRAHELCLQHGYSDFQIMNGSSDVDVSLWAYNGSASLISKPNTMITIQCINPIVSNGVNGGVSLNVIVPLR